jgi:hypothetical protein
MLFAGVEASDLGDGFQGAEKAVAGPLFVFHLPRRWADLPCWRLYIYHCWMAKQEKVWSEAFDWKSFPAPFSRRGISLELAYPDPPL